MSGHFTVLQHANLIVQERQGQHLVYHLNASVLEDVVALLLALTAPQDAKEMKTP